MEKFSSKKDGRGLALGFLAGALLMLWASFDLFGFKTAGQAATLGKQQAAQAVVNAYAGICAAQVKASKDGDAIVAKLKTMERYSRGDVIAKGGFAAMLGEKETSSGLPQACADLLVPEQS